MKSHDCHVFLQRLLSVGICGYLLKNISKSLTELGSFLKKSLLTNIKNLSVETTGSRYYHHYLQAWYDISACFLWHNDSLDNTSTTRSICLLSLCNIYVQNRAHPEGSIVETYIDVESLIFCNHEIHKIYKTFATLEKARTSPPEEVAQDDWLRMCDKWEDEVYQVRLSYGNVV